MAQNEPITTTINGRIMSKIDTAANWDENNPILLKGEVVPVIVPDSDGNTAYVAFKVGDGVSDYATLPFTSANAWDVYDWAKAETKPTYDYSEIKNTPTIPSAPTIDQKYSATSKNAQSGVAVAEALALKVDKVDGKTLTSNDFTSALLSKLNGIAEGANKYVHPTHTAHSTSGLYKITVDALGHVTSATAVTKEDITKLGIPANTDLDGKQDKFANVTNPGICKVEMSNSGKTYFCNYVNDSGIYFDSSIRLLQGKGIKNDDDLVHKKYVDTEVANNKVTVDSEMSDTSTNPVQNKVINTALAGKTDLSASGASSLINKLSTGNSTPSDTDLFISQYVGGGTTNTNYYRRPISTLNTYIKSKADTTPTSGSANLVTSGAVYTALSGKASSTHTHTLNQVTAGAFNTTGSVDYISRSLVPYVSGTKFFGMPAAAITVEYSRDGGATWVDYGLDNGAKMRIFDHSNGVNLYLGRASTKADNNIKNMLRITVDATKSDGRYLSTDSMFTWMTSNGNTTCVTLEVASYNAPTTFRTIVDNAPINGWSGPNMSHYGMITFGGSTAGSTSPNNQFYRLTYKQTAINSNHPSAFISDIRFFGSTVWGGGKAIVNGMLKYGAPYSVRVDPDSSSGAVNFTLLGATFGNGTAADGKYSLAGGINAIVNHECSIAYGRDLNTSAQYQAVFGKYNATSSTALFQVGNGTSTSSRKTAFNVFADGHAEVQTQGTTNNSVVIKSGLNTAIGDYLKTSGIPTNILNDTATASLKQLQDSSYTGIKIKTKNSNAYNLDNTLTDNETIGSLGNFSSSFGGNTQAKGKRSFAIGTGTIAKGGYSFASGSDSVALGSASHVEGYRNTTGPVADSAHAEGGENIVTSNRGHAEGYRNTVSGQDSHAEGGNNTVSGTQAHAEGLGNKATGNYSHSEGQSTEATGDQSHTEGAKTKAIGSASHVEGDTNEGHSYATHIEGSGNKVLTVISSSDIPGTGTSGTGGDPSDPNFNISEHLGANSHVEGTRNLMYGYSAHAEGGTNRVTGHYAHVEGTNNSVSGESAHAEGHENTVDTKYAHAEGNNNTISVNALSSHAEGNGNTVTGSNAHAEGMNNKALADNVHVEGGSNTASSSAAHAEGSNTTASGLNSHAQNANTTASGNNSTAIGYKTVAQSEESFAGGVETVVKGNYSFAFGSKNLIDSNAQNSVAFGIYNTINNSHNDSTVFGYGNKTSASGQFILGRYADSTSIVDKKPIFLVGNGLSDENRSNALEVYKDGHVEVKTVGTTDNSVVNKKYVTTAVNNKLDADTDNYNIAYDTTSEAIKITFKN